MTYCVEKMMENSYYNLCTNEYVSLKKSLPIFQEIFHLSLTLNEPKIIDRSSPYSNSGFCDVQIIIPESGYNFLRDFSITNFCGLDCHYCFHEFMSYKNKENRAVFFSIFRLQTGECVLEGDFYY